MTRLRPMAYALGFAGFIRLIQIRANIRRSLFSSFAFLHGQARGIRRRRMTRSAFLKFHGGLNQRQSDLDIEIVIKQLHGANDLGQQFLNILKRK